MRRLALALSTALALVAAPPAPAAGIPGAPRPTAAQFHDAMRKLWEDHVTYTAFFYTAAIHGGDDVPTVAARLLRNQDDLGDAVKPFYGDAAGTKLASLLRDHILIAADLVAAAKAQDAAAVEAATERWYANADEIAAFLAAANPFWSRAELQEALHVHLAMTTDAVEAKLRGDTAGAIAAYDAGHVHMLMFADTLSSGIIRQFPMGFAPVAGSLR
ncbi:MAG TPA: hypothetical protein VLT61_01130 [Anaeromyxobacteraceae bacterium]|nr:hypothetical protein [Anaeromyxobacteraceae bacterium]